MRDPYAAPHTDIALGDGEWIVGHAIYQGTPAIIFTPAPIPGVPDSPADDAIPSDRIVEGAVVLRFVSMDAAFRHLDRLKLMIENFESKVAAVA